jgi:hypothetical protein
MGRNTPILREIVAVIDQAQALERLEIHFQHRLLVDAGNVQTIATAADRLRLRITTEECAAVLDFIADHQMVVITVDVVETAINELLGEERFVEP